jgi:hypothetical protein
VPHPKWTSLDPVCIFLGWVEIGCHLGAFTVFNLQDRDAQLENSCYESNAKFVSTVLAIQGLQYLAKVYMRFRARDQEGSVIFHINHDLRGEVRPLLFNRDPCRGKGKQFRLSSKNSWPEKGTARIHPLAEVT